MKLLKKKEIIDKSTAKKALQERMMVNLANKMPKDVKVLNQDIKFYQEGNTIKAKLIIEGLEQIGKKQRISTIN